MLSLGIIDLGYKGKNFTWNNKQEGTTLIKEELIGQWPMPVGLRLSLKPWLDISM